MSPLTRIRRFAAATFASSILLGVLLGVPGCDDDPRAPVGHPSMDPDPDLQTALASPDPLALERWVQREGGTRAKAQMVALARSISNASEKEHRRSVVQVRPHLVRLAEMADDAFDLGLTRRGEWMLGLTLEERRRVGDLRSRRAEIDAALLPATEREDALRGLLAESRALGDPPGELAALSALGRCLADQTRIEDALAVYHEALTRARELQDRWYELQFIGVIGHYHEQADEFEAMRSMWEAGFRLADRHRIAEQGARLRVFLANHYAIHGRYSIARELLDEAEVCVRDPSGREFEMRLVQRQMEFYAALQCWEVIDGLLERQEEILRHPPRLPARHIDLYRSRRARLAARRETARGEFEAAAAEWDFAATLARGSPNREEWADVLLERGRTALDAGRIDEAGNLLEDGLAYAEANNLPKRAVTLRALAGAARADGDPAAASSHLDAFARTATGAGTGFAREWALHDATQVRLAMAAGDSIGARTLAARGADRARQIARSTDATGAGYLLLEQLDPVWRAADELERDDPVASLGWEMARRRLRLELGADARSEDPAAADTFGDIGRVQAELARRDATLIVWRTGPERVDVWLVTADRVLREVAPGSVPDSRVAVERFVDAVARGDEEPSTAALVGELLVPPAFREPMESARTVLFCLDGFVALAPLELLPDSEGNPLLDRHDIALLRFHSDRPRAERGGRPLVVGPPDLPRSVTRRWPRLAHLGAGSDEARTVAALLGNAQLLEGAEATKPNILAAWTAPLLHISAHFVRDPMVPFITFVPLAAASGAPREESHLDILDVRRAAFRDTRLVVLSGCGSGAPWVGTVMAPGLGDAFLDAGAHAVVQTRWEVDDNIARDLLTDFTRRYAEGQDPVVALNGAKREARRNGVNAFHWATYSIVLSGL